MKKLFFVLCAALVFIACGDETPKAIELIDGSTPSLVLGADETAKVDGIKFKTTAPWTATVKEVKARAGESDVEWLTLSLYSGDAGTHTVGLTLQANEAEEARKATIEVKCAETLISIAVEQKGTKKDEPGKKAKLISQISETGTFLSDYYEMPENTYTPYKYEFSYDTDFRLKEYRIINKDNTINEKYVYSYDVLGEVRVADTDKDLFRFVLNNDGSVKSIESEYENYKESATFEYNQDKTLSVATLTSIYGYGTTEEYRYVWAEGNVEKINNMDEGDVVYSTITPEYSVELNDKTTIDLNAFFFNIIYSKWNNNDISAKRNLYLDTASSIIGLNGPRSKNYMLSFNNNEQLDYPGMKEPIYVDATLPAVGAVVYTTYYRQWNGKGSYSFDVDGYPISFTRSVDVEKEEATYKGVKKIVVPKDDSERKFWEVVYGPEPWYYITLEKTNDIKVDTYKYNISYMEQ